MTSVASCRIPRRSHGRLSRDTLHTLTLTDRVATVHTHPPMIDLGLNIQRLGGIHVLCSGRKSCVRACIRKDTREKKYGGDLWMHRILTISPTREDSKGEDSTSERGSNNCTPRADLHTIEKQRKRSFSYCEEEASLPNGPASE